MAWQAFYKNAAQRDRKGFCLKKQKKDYALSSKAHLQKGFYFEKFISHAIDPKR